MKLICLLLFILNVFFGSAKNYFGFEKDTITCKMFNVKGKQVKLSKFKGKVVFMHFWASWCGPCKQYFSYSSDLKQKFTKKQLKKIVFLYISVDNDVEAWKKALEKTDVKGVHWVSPANLADGCWTYFKITSIPRFISIDKKGKISAFIAKTPYMFDVYEDLNKLVNE